MSGPSATATVGSLRVEVYATASEASLAAAANVARLLSGPRRQQRVLLAAAPSQAMMLKQLAAAPLIEWSGIDLFQLDEYLGLPSGHPGSFARFLHEHLADRVIDGRLSAIDSDADPEGERIRYGRLVTARQNDVTCLGVGENGHLAFNEPGEAAFLDPRPCALVDLSAISRQQQVNDGTFRTLEEVPAKALTLTIPVLMASTKVVCTVLGARKRDAVRRMLHGPISEACPASILRTHPDATMFLDSDAWAAEPGEVAGLSRL